MQAVQSASTYSYTLYSTVLTYLTVEGWVIRRFKPTITKIITVSSDNSIPS